MSCGFETKAGIRPGNDYRLPAEVVVGVRKPYKKLRMQERCYVAHDVVYTEAEGSLSNDPAKPNLVASGDIKTYCQEKR